MQELIVTETYTNLQLDYERRMLHLYKDGVYLTSVNFLRCGAVGRVGVAFKLRGGSYFDAVDIVDAVGKNISTNLSWTYLGHCKEEGKNMKVYWTGDFSLLAASIEYVDAARHLARAHQTYLRESKRAKSYG